MAGNLESLVHQTELLATDAALAPLTDRELLHRFKNHDENAFRALVRRHGLMVYRTCRRAIANEHDAEDAWQQTFMVLATRSALGSWQESVAGWLHETARRIALKSRTTADRRRNSEHRLPSRQPGIPLDEITGRELQETLDVELARLPEKYRLPLVLCLLEGATRDEAAHRLGWPLSTVKHRVHQGRELLRKRLVQRGLTLSSVLGAAALAGSSAQAAVPSVLVTSTIHAGLQLAGKTQIAAMKSARFLALVQRIVKSVLFSKPKLGAALVLGTGLLAVSAGLLALTRGPEPIPIDPAKSRPEQQQARPADKQQPVAEVDLFGDRLPPEAMARLGTIRFQHGASPRAIAFAPDGRTLASAGIDGTVHIWETSTGKELTRIEDERIPEGAGAVFGLAYSPDGKTIAGAQINHPPCLWDAATGKELRQFGGDKQRASWVVFSPNGKTLAYCGGWKDPTVWLAEVKTGKVLNHFGGHEGFVVPTAFSPDGKIIACADDKSIHLIDVEANKEQELALPDNHAIRYSSLAFSPDGKMLVASSKANKLIRLVEVATAKIVHDITLPTKSELAVPILFTLDGKKLISGHSDGIVRFWDVKSGVKMHEFRAYSQFVLTLALSPDGRTLATASNSNEENGVRLWETASGKRLVPLPGPQKAISFLVFSPDSRRIATASSGVHVWEASTGKLLQDWDVFGSLAFTPDGKTLVCGGWRDGKVHFLDLATGKESRQFQAHADNIFCLAIAADGKTLVTAGYDGFLKLWDLTTGHLLQDFGGKQKSYVWKVSLSPDARLLASIHQDDHVVRLWETGTGKLFREQSESDFVDGVSFSPDGRLVAVICRDDVNQKMFVRFREVATGNEVRLLPLGHGYRCDRVAYTPDGRTLIWGGPDRNLYLWEVATGQLRRKFSGHQGQLTCVAYSPNGRMMASGSFDASALIWEVTGQHSKKQAANSALSPEQLEKLWNDLAEREAVKSYQSLCQLRAIPDQAIPLLIRHLKPVPIADAKRFAEALRNLDSDTFTVRDRAVKDLEDLGEGAEGPLRKALEEKPTAEVKRQVERLLGQLEGSERLRQGRALEVLEHIGNEDALKLLKRFTEGAPDAGLTRQAKEALARMEK
jgi:RNA polymerase sigma factor (sigma-70 family)